MDWLILNDKLKSHETRLVFLERHFCKEKDLKFYFAELIKGSSFDIYTHCKYELYIPQYTIDMIKLLKRIPEDQIISSLTNGLIFDVIHKNNGMYFGYHNLYDGLEAVVQLKEILIELLH